MVAGRRERGTIAGANDRKGVKMTKEKKREKIRHESKSLQAYFRAPVPAAACLKEYYIWNGGAPYRRLGCSHKRIRDHGEQKSDNYWFTAQVSSSEAELASDHRQLRSLLHVCVCSHPGVSTD